MESDFDDAGLMPEADCSVEFMGKPVPQHDRLHRLYRVYIPRRRLTIVRLFLLILACVVGFLIGVTVGIGLVYLLLRGLPTTPVFGYLRVLVITTSAVVGSIALCRMITPLEPMFNVPWPPGRLPRLRALVRHPESVPRLPHRQVEYSIRSRGGGTRRFKKVLRALPPGRLILIDDASPEFNELPLPIDVPFEPVCVDDDSERAVRLLIRCIPWTSDPSSVDSNSDSEAWTDHDTVITRAIGRRRWLLHGLAVLSWGFLLLMLVRDLQSGGPRPILFLFLILGLAISVPLFFQRRWWIIPGGLVSRESSALRRELKVTIHTRTTASLIVNWQDGRAYVMEGRRLRTISCNYPGYLLLVASWIGRLEPPEEKTIRSAMGV